MRSLETLKHSVIIYPKDHSRFSLKFSFNPRISNGIESEAIKGAVKKAILKFPFAAKLPATVIDKASNILAQALSGASSEFSQETGQGLLEQHYGERKPWREVLSPSNIHDVAKDEGLIGGVVGGLTGGAFSAFSGSPSVSENSVTRPSPVEGIDMLSTPNQQQIMDEYQAAVDPGLVQFIEDVKAGKLKPGERYEISKVTPETAAQIKALLGLDVEGVPIEIQAASVVHINRRHGEKGQADSSMANTADIARAKYVLDNSDSIEVSKRNLSNFFNSDGTRAKSLIVRKKVNGTHFVVETAPNAKDSKVYVLSMWKTSDKRNKAKPPMLADADLSPPDLFVRNEHQDNSASDLIIPNPSQETTPDIDNLSSYSRAFFEPQMPQGTGDVRGKVRDIKKIVANTLGMPVREGNIRIKNTLGFINHTKQVIRTKYNNDVSVMLHEFGHAIDASFGLSRNSNAALQELSSFGAAMGYPQNKHLSEGLAQFFQWYGIDPGQARQQFPQYTKIFEDFINSTPEAKALIAPVFQATKEYYHGSPVARLRAAISDGSPVPLSLQQRVESMAKNAYIQLVDRYADISKVNELTAKTLGIDKRMIPDEYNLEAAVRTYPGVMRKIGRDVEHITSQLGQINGPEYQQMVDYLTAGGALDYYTNNMEPGVGLNAVELQQIRANTPQNISLLADEIRNAFQQVVDDTLVRSGVISPRMIADWRKKYPNYVPMIADTTDGEVQLLSPVAALNRGFVDQPNPIKKRRGAKSDRDIITRINPFESMIKNIATYHAIAAKNDVGRVALNISKLDGLAKVAEAVPGPGKNTFYVWENGKKKYFATDPEIYAALKVLGEYKVSDHMIANFAHKTSEVFKAGTTRYNPWFIAKNFFRDSFTASVQVQAT